MAKRSLAENVALSIWSAGQHEAVLTGLLVAALREDAALGSKLMNIGGAQPRAISPKAALQVFQQRPLSASDDSDGGLPDVMFKLGRRFVLVEAKAKAVTAQEAAMLGIQLDRYEAALNDWKKDSKKDSAEDLAKDELLAVLSSTDSILKIALVGGRSDDLPPAASFGDGVHIVTWHAVLSALENCATGSGKCLATVLSSPDVAVRLGTRVPLSKFRLSRILRAAYFDDTVRGVIDESVITALDGHWDPRRIASPWTVTEEGWSHSGATSRWVHKRAHRLSLNIIRSVDGGGKVQSRWLWSFPFLVAATTKWFRDNRDITNSLKTAGDARATKSGIGWFWVTDTGSSQRLELNLCGQNVEAEIVKSTEDLPAKNQLVEISSSASNDRLVSGFWSMVLEVVRS